MNLRYLLPIFLFLLLVSWIKWGPLPRYSVDINSNNILLTDTISIFEGKRLALTICSKCHYNEDYGTLAGRKHGNPAKLGYFFSGNITRDSIHGIGPWTASQLYYFLRTGVKPDGTFVFDMPKYPNLSDEDLVSLVAFLKSDDKLLDPTPFPNPAPKYSFITRALLQFWLRPEPWDNSYIPNPDTTNMIQWGKYLSTAKFSCFDCHSGNAVTNNYSNPERSWRFFKGGNPHADEEGNKVVSPSLLLTVKSWTVEEFNNAVRKGYAPDGRMLKDPMFPFVMITDKEAEAIFIYLNSL